METQYTAQAADNQPPTYPDEYEVKWARARMWRMKAGTNYEARERLRASSNPLDRRALQILELNDVRLVAERAKQ